LVHFGCRETKLDEKKKKDQSVLGSRPGVGLNQRTGLIVNQKTQKLRRKLSPPQNHLIRFTPRFDDRRQ
jgi:hypothetical protein